jgi:hypothetical protein
MSRSLGFDNMRGHAPGPELTVVNEHNRESDFTVKR